MRTTIIFISFCSSARKVKSILFSRKKVASMKKWLHNILENAFQPCSIFILWIHQLFTETSNLRTFCLIQMVLLSSLISGGPIILMMTIEDLPIVEHQSILLRRWSNKVVMIRHLMYGILVCYCLSFWLVLHHLKVEVKTNSSATFFHWRSNGQRVSQELLETWFQNF